MGGLLSNSTLRYPHVRGDFRGVTGVGVLASSQVGPALVGAGGKSARILVALTTPYLSGKSERGWMRGRVDIDVSRVVEGGSGEWEAFQGEWLQWESEDASGSENEGVEGDALLTLTVEGENCDRVLIDRLWLVR